MTGVQTCALPILIEGDYTAKERIAKREAVKKEAAEKEAAKKQVESERKSNAKPASTLKLSQGSEGGTVSFSSDVEAKPLANEDEDDKVFKKIVIRNIATCAVLAITAFLLQLITFRLPLMPNMIRTDLSAIPELLAAVSFGPIAGVAIVLIKNGLFAIIMGDAVAATAISNAIMDSAFVGVASFIFARGMFSPMAIEKRMMEDPEGVRDNRGKMIFKSGLIGALVATPISYFTVTKIAQPMIFRQFGAYGYTAESYLVIYNDALRALNSHLPAPLNGIITEIPTLSRGVLIYNLPFTFLKYIAVTVIVAIIFKWLSKILFYRPTLDPEDVETMKKQQQNSQKK